MLPGFTSLLLEVNQMGSWSARGMKTFLCKKERTKYCFGIAMNQNCFAVFSSIKKYPEIKTFKGVL